MSKRILIISFAFIFTLIIGMFVWMSQGETVTKSDLVSRNASLPLDSTISWQTPTVRVADVPTENSADRNNTTSMADEPISNISPITDIPGTALPSPPPMSKWRLASDYSFDSPKDSVFQTDDSENTFNIHGIVINGEIVTVFFSTNTISSNDKTSIPRTIQLKSGNEKETATSIIILGEMENVVFGAFTVHIPENHLSQLDLEISDVIVENKEGKQDEISGNWKMPLLEDLKPEESGSYTLQIMMTKSNDVVYDKISIFEGDPTKSIETGVGGRPDVTDGITRFFVFTLKSPIEQQGIYIFLMADGSIKKPTEKEYLEKLKMLFAPPTPVPPAKNDGIDAQWTPEPIPVELPSQITVEEMIKRATSEATTK